MPTDEDLSRLQWTTVLYYLHETNPDNGLVRDKTDPAAPCSIAAVGMALATIPVVVERGVVIRKFAAKIARRRLRHPPRPPAGPGAGRRRVQGLLLPLPRHRDRPPRLGVRAVHARLGVPVRRHAHLPPPTSTRDTADEAEVRRLADALYRRADWDWARNGGPTLTHGWRPETGFLPHRWEGYDEGLLLYVLGLGSPTHPLPPESYAAYCATYQWKQLYGRELLYSGPLFTHQLSHLWIDFRGLRDAFMRDHGSDYFENSRQATYVQQEYAVHNPMQFAGYGEHCWGFTACDGPGWVKRVVDGVERQFFDYIARGAPFGPDDGTVAPWVVVASLPFAPEIVIPTVRHLAGLKLGGQDRPYGFKPLVQPDVPRGRQPDRLVGDALPLRHRPGAGGADDRELPHRPDLGHHAPLPVRRRRPAAGRLHGRLAVARPGRGDS